MLFGPWTTGEGINPLFGMIDVAFGYDDGVRDYGLVVGSRTLSGELGLNAYPTRIGRALHRLPSRPSRSRKIKEPATFGFGQSK